MDDCFSLGIDLMIRSLQGVCPRQPSDNRAGAPDEPRPGDPRCRYPLGRDARRAEVRPRGDGTLAIAGSHRVVARFAKSLSPELYSDPHLTQRFLRHDDWLRALARPGGGPERTARFMDRDHQADGITLRVTELTGQPGDVVLTHPWVLHSTAPDTGTYPRMMLTKNLYRQGIRRLELDPADLSPVYASAFLLEREGRLAEAAESWRYIVEYCDTRGWDLTAAWRRQELQRLRELLGGHQDPGR